MPAPLKDTTYLHSLHPCRHALDIYLPSQGRKQFRLCILIAVTVPSVFTFIRLNPFPLLTDWGGEH